MNASISRLEHHLKDSFAIEVWLQLPSFHQTQHSRMLADQIAQLSFLPGTSLNTPGYTEYSGTFCALYLIDLDGWMGKQFDTVDR